MALNLKDLVVETKQAELEVPGYAGFKVTINLITRAKTAKLKQDCMVTKYSKSGPVQDLDLDKFISKFVAIAVSGWEGLTGKHLKDLMPVDESLVKDDDVIEFTMDNAVELVRNSEVFDSWLNSHVFELDSFRTK